MHRPALFSNSLALSQTPAKAARPTRTEHCTVCLFTSQHNLVCIKLCGPSHPLWFIAFSYSVLLPYSKKKNVQIQWRQSQNKQSCPLNRDMNYAGSQTHACHAPTCHCFTAVFSSLTTNCDRHKNTHRQQSISNQHKP